MDYDLNYEVPLSHRARLSPEGVPGRTGDSACARPCMWLDANTDALRPVLTGAFVVPVISTQLLDSRVPQAQDVAMATRRHTTNNKLRYFGGGGGSIDVPLGLERQSVREAKIVSPTGK